jgi:hypothetical protein
VFCVLMGVATIGARASLHANFLRFPSVPSEGDRGAEMLKISTPG